MENSPRKKKINKSEIPKLIREFEILSWSEIFTDYLSETIKTKYILLIYIIRSQNIIIVIDHTALVYKKSHIAVSGSIITDLIIYITHDYLFYTDNNR